MFIYNTAKDLNMQEVPILCKCVLAVGRVGSEGDLGEEPTLDYPAQPGGIFGNAHI